MRFTTRDIADNIGMVNFVRGKAKQKVLCTKLVDDYLLNVYDTDDIIEILNDKIKRHDPKMNRFVPIWKNHIKYLKKMEV